MKNLINVTTIILHVLELIRKYGMLKNEAAIATAGKLNINLSEVLEVLANYLKEKDWIKELDNSNSTENNLFYNLI